MSQTFTDDCFAGGHVAQTDMGNIENNFAAVKSSFSGSSAPADPVPFMPWGDTGNEIPRFRDVDDEEWLALMPCDDGDEGGGAKGYIWLYRNNTVDGMVVDTTVSDRVLAVKGGSNAYNVNGGITAGTAFSTLAGHAHPHGHAGGTLARTITITIPEDGWGEGTNSPDGRLWSGIAPTQRRTASRQLTGSAGSWSGAAASDSTASNITDARPAAAVGTLQRPDI